MPDTLDLEITPEGHQEYKLLLRMRGGREPLAQSRFSYDVSYMKEYEIRHLDVDAKDPQGRFERLKAFGASLFTRVFQPEVLGVWRKYKSQSDFLTLCIRIDREADELEVLPWETLWDGEEFIAAGARTGMSRLPLDVPIANDLPAIPQPIKMIAFVSSPLDLPETERLQIEREQEILLQATNSPAGQGKLHIYFEDEAKLTILESCLEAGYHVFHYSGHGIRPEDASGLLFEDAQGKRKPVPVHELLDAFKKGTGSLRLAVLSSCQTARTLHVSGFRDLARGLVRMKIPAVLAMQFSITDRSGLMLAEQLYPRLADGQRLEVALSACRRAMLHSDEAEVRADAFAPSCSFRAAMPCARRRPNSPRQLPSR